MSDYRKTVITGKNPTIKKFAEYFGEFFKSMKQEDIALEV